MYVCSVRYNIYYHPSKPHEREKNIRQMPQNNANVRQIKIKTIPNIKITPNPILQLSDKLNQENINEPKFKEHKFLFAIT